MTQLTSGRADRILGVVLAGGASRRFESPKWSAKLAGLTMGERAVAALEPNTAKVGVVANDPALAALGVEVRSDLRAGKGPLGALHTALHWAQELSLSAVFLLACDLPLAGAEVVRTVVDTWTDDDVVVPFGPRGPEPLCGLYSVHLLPEVERALSVDELALHALVERVHARRVPMHAAQAASGLADPFLNVNTREDLARAATALSSRVAE